jgi:hypothetical protein
VLITHRSLVRIQPAPLASGGRLTHRPGEFIGIGELSGPGLNRSRTTLGQFQVRVLGANKLGQALKTATRGAAFLNTRLEAGDVVTGNVPGET